MRKFFIQLITKPFILNTAKVFYETSICYFFLFIHYQIQITNVLQIKKKIQNDNQNQFIDYFQILVPIDSFQNNYQNLFISFLINHMFEFLFINFLIIILYYQVSLSVLKLYGFYVMIFKYILTDWLLIVILNQINLVQEDQNSLIQFLYAFFYYQSLPIFPVCALWTWAFYFFDSFDAENRFCERPNVHVFLNRYLFFFIIVLRVHTDYQSLLIYLCLLHSSYSIWTHIYRPHILSFDTYLFSFCSNFTYFWICVGFVVSNILQKEQIWENLHAYILGGGLSIFLLKNFILEKILREIDFDHLNDMNPHRQFFLLKLIYDVLEKYIVSGEGQQIIYGKIQKHIENCQNKHCFCRKKKSLILPRNHKTNDPNAPSFRDNVFIYKFIEYQLMQNLRLEQSVFKIHTLMYYEFFVIGNIFKTKYLHQIVDTRLRTKRSIMQIYIQKKVNYLVNQYYEVKTKEVRDYKRVKKYEVLVKQVLGIFRTLIQMLETVWDNLYKQRIEVNQLLPLFNKIYKKKLQARSNLETLNKIKPNQDTVQILGSFMYQVILRQNREWKLTNKNKVLSKFTLSEECIVMQSSFGESELGKIEWVSQSQMQILKFDRKRILTLSINELMPISIADKHDLVLQDFFCRGTSKVLEQRNSFWLIDSKGFLMHSYVTIKPTLIKNKIKAFSKLEPNKAKELIHINRLGQIVGISEQLYGFLFQDQISMDQLVSLSLIPFIPSIIPMLLKDIYKINHFQLDKFSLRNYRKTLYFQYQNQEELIKKLIDIQRQSLDSLQYLKTLHKVIRKLTLKDVKRVYLLKFSVQEFEFKNQIHFREMEVREISLVTNLREEDFDQQRVFLEKISFSERLLTSIKQLQQDKEEEKNYQNKLILKEKLTQQLSSTNQIDSMVFHKHFKSVAIPPRSNQDRLKSLMLEQETVDLSKFSQLISKTVKTTTQIVDQNDQRKSWINALSAHYNMQLNNIYELIEKEVHICPKIYLASAFYLDHSQQLEQQSIQIYRPKIVVQNQIRKIPKQLRLSSQYEQLWGKLKRVREYFKNLNNKLPWIMITIITFSNFYLIINYKIASQTKQILSIDLIEDINSFQKFYSNLLAFLNYKDFMIMFVKNDFLSNDLLSPQTTIQDDGTNYSIMKKLFNVLRESSVNFQQFVHSQRFNQFLMEEREFLIEGNYYSMQLIQILDKYIVTHNNFDDYLQEKSQTLLVENILLLDQMFDEFSEQIQQEQKAIIDQVFYRLIKYSFVFVSISSVLILLIVIVLIRHVYIQQKIYHFVFYIFNSVKLTYSTYYRKLGKRMFLVNDQVESLKKIKQIELKKKKPVYTTGEFKNHSGLYFWFIASVVFLSIFSISPGVIQIAYIKSGLNASLQQSSYLLSLVMMNPQLFNKKLIEFELEKYQVDLTYNHKVREIYLQQYLERILLGIRLFEKNNRLLAYDYAIFKDETYQSFDGLKMQHNCYTLHNFISCKNCSSSFFMKLKFKQYYNSIQFLVNQVYYSIMSGGNLQIINFSNKFILNQYCIVQESENLILLSETYIAYLYQNIQERIESQMRVVNTQFSLYAVFFMIVLIYFYFMQKYYDVNLDSIVHILLIFPSELTSNSQEVQNYLKKYSRLFN